MSIFVVFSASMPDRLRPVIEEHYRDDNLEVKPGQWLISANETARDLSTRLGLLEPHNGAAIVFKMDSYFGRAPTDIWDWIKTKSEA